MDDTAKRQKWAANMAAAAERLIEVIEDLEAIRLQYDANGYSGTLTQEHVNGGTTAHLLVDDVMTGLFTFEQITTLLRANGNAFLSNLYRLSS